MVSRWSTPEQQIDTFNFDLRNSKELSLSDVLCEGTDPLIAIPPIARPYVEHVVNAEGDPDFDISHYEPGGLGVNYADNYQAWYLDAGDLVLVMPKARYGPAPAGMWQPHIPLSELHSILREGGCSL